VSQKPITYDARHIQVLEGREAVRKRPGMYIGSTGERGLHQLVFEAAGRALDEVMVGRASRVEITLLPDGGVRVADDGPGCPFEDCGDAGGSGLHAVLTRLMVREGRIGPRFPVVGPLGIGLAVVNALSSRLVAEVQYDGVRRAQEYARGVASGAPTSSAPVDGTGTIISFWPDASIFETTECSFAELTERFRELALLNRDLEIKLTDTRTSEPFSIRLRSAGGARDVVAFLDEQESASADAEVLWFEREDSRMAGMVEVALRWRASGPERCRSFANSRPTPGGGTHMVGFHEGLSAALTAYACERGLLTAADPDLDTELIGEGLTAVVSVKLEQPEFEGSTHGVLGNAAARACVRQAVYEGLGAWLSEHPQRAAAVIDQVVQGHRSH
jgi:DNA gyrase subunit B